jgi:hypothetical protein
MGNAMNDQPKSPTDAEREIFLESLKHESAEQRAVFLDRACANNPAIRLAVETLLKHHKEDEFMQPPGFRSVLLSALEKPGDRIGRYKLLQQIGEGGCGVVYMAEQEEPVRRQVALKVIKLGMDTKNVIARFEAERQALALMDHPNIAKVLDASATETGRPYFVMELVRGIKITDYCDNNHLPTRERLILFVQVCQAIQHAHQKGIIHRDIKPSNILVTLRDGVPVPKVIDFGIAKATTEQRLTDKTLFTAFEQFIGTPTYMSPEQAEMSELGIDTRSDIYSLGVLLYELLTGQTPFDSNVLLQAGLAEIRRIIREEEPIRPSTRLSTMLAGDHDDRRPTSPGPAGQAQRPDSGRLGLDRDEVFGERPRPPIRNGQRPGEGHPAPFAARARNRRWPWRWLSLAQIREKASPGCDGRELGFAVVGRWDYRDNVGHDGSIARKA